MRLDGVLAAPQAPDQTAVDPRGDALDVLIGGADVERAVPLDEVGQLGVGGGLVLRPRASWRAPDRRGDAGRCLRSLNR